MFANPQVTIERMFTYSAAGINILDVFIFIIIQFIGAIFAVYIWENYIKKCARAL
jgi:glycerol uptake facilitator-like aquaporin